MSQNEGAWVACEHVVSNLDSLPESFRGELVRITRRWVGPAAPRPRHRMSRRDSRGAECHRKVPHVTGRWLRMAPPVLGRTRNVVTAAPDPGRALRARSRPLLERPDRHLRTMLVPRN